MVMELIGGLLAMLFGVVMSLLSVTQVFRELFSEDILWAYILIMLSTMLVSLMMIVFGIAIVEPYIAFS